MDMKIALSILAPIAKKKRKNASIISTTNWATQPTPNNALRRRLKKRVFDAENEKKIRGLVFHENCISANKPEFENTPADLYLQSRGIFLTELKTKPFAVRYHPSIYTIDNDQKYQLPAVLSVIYSYEFQMRPIGLHKFSLNKTNKLGHGANGRLGQQKKSWGKCAADLYR